MSETTKTLSPQVDGSHPKGDRLATPSERRLKANRENAKKSTGPWTPRGKAYSSRNAIKHGLFVSSTTNFFLQSENSKDYEELRNDLWKQYQPIGRAEELEVESIAKCWWRFQRAWRFENARTLVAGGKQLSNLSQQSKALHDEEQDSIHQLGKLRDEIESTGVVPSDLKERVIAISPHFEKAWPFVEAFIEYCLTKPPVSKLVEDLTPERRAAELAGARIDVIIQSIRDADGIREKEFRGVAHDLHAIPNSDVLDRMLRYEAAIDRNLTRALDRLERLQSARKGEAVLPLLKVRRTQ